MVESQSDEILGGAKEKDVSFLVVGDPFGCARARLQAIFHAAAAQIIGESCGKTVGHASQFAHTLCGRAYRSVAQRAAAQRHLPMGHADGGVVTLWRKCRTTTHTDLELRARPLVNSAAHDGPRIETCLDGGVVTLWPKCRATTHTDLELRARALGIPVKVIHNASIMNAVGVCGLQLYRFGEV